MPNMVNSPLTINNNAPGTGTGKKRASGEKISAVTVEKVPPTVVWNEKKVPPRKSPS